jgi:DNA-binding NtrC family response regulator
MKKNKRILVVEDSKQQLGQILDTIKMAGYEPMAVTSIAEAKAAFTSTVYPILLTDMHLTSSLKQDTFEGLELLSFVKTNHPEVLPLMMSSDPKLETYQKAQALGALHFFRKPILSADEFSIGLASAKLKLFYERSSRSGMPPTALPNELLEFAPDGVLIDAQTRLLASKVAASRTIPIVIHGETGTGKEEIAKLIHRNRVANEGSLPFVCVNCANLSGDLSASVLFGHKKGAFTGATETTNGFIGEADGGILFLDEIHALSASCQQRLLRVLNDGTFERVGESRSQSSEFQVISASTRDLDEEVEAGRFLIDLRMRVTGIDFHLPPLRERLQDMQMLITLFFAREGVPVPELEIAKIAERCREVSWKGNIRQLFKVLQSLVVLASFSDEGIKSENLLLPLRAMEAKAPTSSVDDHDLNRALSIDTPFQEAVELFERMKIKSALSSGLELKEIMNRLDFPKSSFYTKLKKYSLSL